MKPTDLTHCQRQVLANVIRRLRKQASSLENVIGSGDRKKLAEACEMLHVTMTQLLWVRSSVEPGVSGILTPAQDKQAS